ncbi:MAG TPA: histidine--tRNA ligase [Candidatus Bipolaricaulota bacterium]
MELQLPRGMRDFAPAEKLLRDTVIAKLKATFERYGFNPLETPIVERWEVLCAKYGGGEEILKETFRLKDQGERDLGLRYDLTTPLARFVGMNPTIKKPFKRYQIGTVYRDGPLKKGRTREFYQCDVDTVGATSMLADAECILLALDVFEQIGLDVEVRVNNRKLLVDLARTFLDAEDPQQALDFILSIDKLEKIGTEGVVKELRDKGFKQDLEQVFALLITQGDNATKFNRLKEAVKGDSGWSSELAEVLDYAGQDRRVRFLPSLARGLGYYTGTIFEVFIADGSFDGSLAAGGRYDKLIGDFLDSKEQFPAVGISFGLGPIIELLKDRRPLDQQPQSVTKVYVVPIQTTKESLELVKKLRSAGIAADMDLIGRGPSANFKYANAYGIPYVIVVGPDELAAGVVTLKDMQSGQEEKLSFERAVEKLRSST